MISSSYEPSQKVESKPAFLHPLTFGKSAVSIGFRIGGERPGPNLLVIGHSLYLEAIIERLCQIQSIPWMWGNIYLVMDDALDEDIAKCPAQAIAQTPFDDIIKLRSEGVGLTPQKHVRQGYFKILKKCSALGMITGRGVPEELI